MVYALAGDIVDAAAELLGKPGSQLSEAETLLALGWIDAELPTLWIWKDWAEVCKLAQVFYRPAWDTSALEDDEVYHADEYWRALADTSAEPSDESVDWESFTPDPLALELASGNATDVYKPWRIFFDEPEHVDESRGLRYGTAGGVVTMVDDAPASVWIWYAPTPPKFRAAEFYDAAATYVEGDLVYDPTTRDVYLRPETAASFPDDWERQQAPLFMRRWLEHAVAKRWLVYERQREMAYAEEREMEKAKVEAFDYDQQWRGANVD